MARCALLAFALLVTACAGGQEAPRPASFDGRLFAKVLRDGGAPVVSIDLATGHKRIVPFSRLGGGDPPFQLAVTGGHLVFYGARSYAESQAVYTIDVERPGSPRRLGRPSYFLPSATDGRLWHVRGASVSELMVADGRVIARGGRPPCRGLTTLAAVEGALVCQARSELRAFDPAGGRVLLRLRGPFPAATWGRLVAWCTEACLRVRVTDVHRHRTMVIAPGEGFRFEATYEGAFSLDGSLLAMPALRGGASGVAVIDLRAHTSRLIPGATLGGYRQLAWSPSGDRLLFTAAPGRLMAWRPGGGRAVPVPVKVRGTIMDMATSR
jgi:hypothetical protein